MSKKRYIALDENGEPLKNEDGSFVYEELEINPAPEPPSPEPPSPEPTAAPEEKTDILKLVQEEIAAIKKQIELNKNINEPFKNDGSTPEKNEKDYGMFVPILERK